MTEQDYMPLDYVSSGYDDVDDPQLLKDETEKVKNHDFLFLSNVIQFIKDLARKNSE